MYPLESGGCTILGLSSPCPSHLLFSNHVFFLQLRPPSEAPHPPALNPGAGKGEGLQTVWPMAITSPLFLAGSSLPHPVSFYL